MLKNLAIVCVIVLAIVLSGCATAGKSIMAKQTWSENYAKMKGVVATSPAMVDGDPGTSADTQTPSDSSTATKYTEAVVKLPEQKSIRKIVIDSTNLQSFAVYAGGTTENDWKMLKEVKNSEDLKVTLNVSATTDKIRIRVVKTSDDTTTPGGLGGQARLKRAPAKIKEIEIYGYAKDAQAPTAQVEAVGITATSGTTTGTTSKTSTGTASTAKAGTTTVTTAVPAEVPKGPPITATLEIAQKSFPSVGPVPLKINIKAGADEVVTLEDILSDKMISTKLIVKSASGNAIASSKPTPPLSSPRPYRAVDRPMDVRNALTIQPNTVLAVNIVNLLDYYAMATPGTYTIQLVTWVDLHDKFVGRETTEKDDIESQIRDINSKYTAQEKTALIQNLKDELTQSKKKKTKRYIETSIKGKPYKLESDTIEIIIQ
jgi:hypothetical protein